MAYSTGMMNKRVTIAKRAEDQGDTFGKSGPALELLEIFGLNAQNIAEKAKKAIALKK